MAWETREAKKAKDYERDRTKEKKRAEEQVSIDNKTEDCPTIALV